jgi:hypothetical protein
MEVLATILFEAENQAAPGCISIDDMNKGLREV